MHGGERKLQFEGDADVNLDTSKVSSLKKNKTRISINRAKRHSKLDSRSPEAIQMRGKKSTLTT
jgi:hypothetical protein